MRLHASAPSTPGLRLLASPRGPARDGRSLYTVFAEATGVDDGLGLDAERAQANAVAVTQAVPVLEHWSSIIRVDIRDVPPRPSSPLSHGSRKLHGCREMARERPGERCIYMEKDG